MVRRLVWPDNVIISAQFGGKNDCYRYTLKIAEKSPKILKTILWIMMNPSVADLNQADATLLKTNKYRKAWGYTQQTICNVFAFRATDNKKLLVEKDPFGPDNNRHIFENAKFADLIVLAYGFPPKPLQKHCSMLTANLLEKGIPLHYLEMANNGFTPKHPLYLKANLTPIKYPHSCATVLNNLDFKGTK